MARALADEWRVRILSELSVRPLSPSCFAKEVGGDLSKIARHFRQLADWGWIEVIEERPGRRQGAATEHVYRGIQRANFDPAAWESLPRCERDEVSRTTIRAFLARVLEANRAGTFDQELDRQLSWDSVAIDRIAWNQVGKRLDEILLWLAELAVESNDRLRHGGGERIPAIVGLAAFRAPYSPRVLMQASRLEHGQATDPGGGFAISPKVAKALANRWRCRILMELSAKPMSPSQFAEENGGSASYIARCFRDLAKWGFTEVFEERKGGRKGGGVEKVYRAIHRP